MTREPLRRGVPGRLQGTSRAAHWRRSRARRVLAGLLAAAAVVTTIAAVRPSDPPTRQVVVADRDLPAGHTITAGDLEVQQWPKDAGPARLPGRDELVGRTVTGPIAAHAPLTHGQLRGRTSLPQVPSTQVVMTLPVQDPALLRLLQPGDHVDVLGMDGARLAEQLRVLAVEQPQADPRSTRVPTSAVVLAVPRTTAGAIARGRGAADGLGASITLALRMSDPA